ncbi:MULTISPECIES: homoserine dehydrogenase [unclassified Luteococcus]|uniref:homoserine dehydrogenase n=1 Tax=unclassified Luteococcus TaxID=2639923 RepID=UPI00313CD15A
MNRLTPADPAKLPPLKVALLGCGVVGSQVARLITEQSDDLTNRIGRRIELAGIAVRTLDRDFGGLDPQLFTTDAMALVSRDDLDVVVEVVGGIEPTRQLILTAIQHGASVVTANKALLAEDTESLFRAAEQHGVDLYYEAAVAGAIPIVRPLRESLVGDEITTVMGIVNGTTNYILDQMTTTGADFDDALKQAQELGYAEADPTADIEGYDAAAKAAIMATLAFHTRVRGADVYREGITGVTSADIAAAHKLGCVVKMLAILGADDQGRVSVRVHPVMLPAGHPLATVGGAYNAIFVESREAGRLMFMGPGAGGSPTASAVMGDLVTVARNRVRGVAGPGETVYAEREITPMGQIVTRYLVRASVVDEPGVLAAAAAVFAGHNVSVQTVDQSSAEPGPDGEKVAVLALMTHCAREEDLQAVVRELEGRPFTRGELSVIRVEGL